MVEHIIMFLFLSNYTEHELGVLWGWQWGTLRMICVLLAVGRSVTQQEFDINCLLLQRCVEGSFGISASVLLVWIHIFSLLTHSLSSSFSSLSVEKKEVKPKYSFIREILCHCKLTNHHRIEWMSIIMARDHHDEMIFVPPLLSCSK